MTEAKIILENQQSNVQGKSLIMVKFIGQLDESNIDQLIQNIYKAIELNPKNLNLIFDFEGLDYMNSKTIGYLTDIYGKITENGGNIIITKAKSNIVDILQVVGLSQLIKMLSSNEEAMLELGKNQTNTNTQMDNTTKNEQPIQQEVPKQPEPIVEQKQEQPIVQEPIQTVENTTLQKPVVSTDPITPVPTENIINTTEKAEAQVPVENAINDANKTETPVPMETPVNVTDTPKKEEIQQTNVTAQTTTTEQTAPAGNTATPVINSEIKASFPEETLNSTANNTTSQAPTTGPYTFEK